MRIKVFEIVNWTKHFENNRTRELKKLAWVPVPNKFDGDGYTELMDQPEGTRILGTWLLLLEVASKCLPRGLLIRSELQPHDAKSLSRITRAKVEDFEIAVPVLVNMSWLRCNDIEDTELSVLIKKVAARCGEPPIEGKGRERNRTEEKERTDGLDPSITEKQKNLTRARTAAYSEIIPYLNEKTNRRYSVLNKATQRHINARLSEGYTVDNFKTVIDKKTREWLNDPKMDPYLRPQTLFAGNFESYLNQPEVGPGGSTTVSERTGHLFEKGGQHGND